MWVKHTINAGDVVHYTDRIGRYTPSAGNDHVKAIFGHAREAPCFQNWAPRGHAEFYLYHGHFQQELSGGGHDSGYVDVWLIFMPGDIPTTGEWYLHC